MSGLNAARLIGVSGLNVTPNIGFMSAPSVDGRVETSIVIRKRVGAQQVGEAAKGCVKDMFHTCMVFFLAFSVTPFYP